jgi:hypothetical protein
MKISKQWKRILIGVMNLILVMGPLVYLGIFPNLHQDTSSYSETLFFSLLDDTNLTLAQAKDEYQHGEIEIAKITLKQYYLNRPNDTGYDLISNNLTEEMEHVDLVIQRIFTHSGKTFQLHNYSGSDTVIVNGREIPNTNWHENPNPQDNEWIWQISRWEWIEDFGRAYLGNNAIGNITQAELIARECIDLITDFIQKEPVGSAYTWRTIDSALRVWKILTIGEALKRSTYFTPDFCFLFLRFIADHGRFIAEFHKDRSNWVSIESQALLRICEYFSEFTPTQDWEQEVWNTLSMVAVNTNCKDGATRESLLNYHLIAASPILSSISPIWNNPQILEEGFE